MKDKKLFVGGYYDDRIFLDESFAGKTAFNKTIDTYTFDEVLKLAFIENVKENFDEKCDITKWDDLSMAQQIIEICDYAQTDAIAGLTYCANEAFAEGYKNEVLDEILDIECETYYSHLEQDAQGNFNQVWILEQNENIEIGKSLTYKNLNFTIASYHEIFKKYNITITRDNVVVSSGIFVEPKYLTPEKLSSEIKRLYEVLKGEI